jgi:hypothetical protein
MKILYILIILTTLLISCKNEIQNKNELNNTFAELVTIELNKTIENKTAFPVIINSIKSIVLETNESSLLVSVNKIRTTKDHLYLLDRSGRRVLMFDYSGNFIRVIGSKGHGPGEFPDIFDFDLDEIENKIWIYTPAKSSMITYDLLGNYLSEQRLNFGVYRFAYLNDDKFAFFVGYFDDKNNNLKITNSQAQLLYESFNYGRIESPMTFPFTGGIVRNSTGVLYSDATSSLIYQIDKDFNVFNKYKLDFNERSWPEVNKYDFQLFFNKIQNFELGFLGSNYYESDNWLSFDYTLTNKRYKGFYNKNNNTLYSGDNIADGALYRLMSSVIGTTSNGDFISTISLADYHMMKESNKYTNDLENTYPELYQLLETLSKEQNPLITIFSLN